MLNDRFTPPIGTVFCKDRNGEVSAQGILEGDDTLVILKGSTARGEPSEIVNKRLLKQGVVERRGGILVFLKDYSFNKPSPAAKFILGRNVNGKSVWKDQRGRSLADLFKKKRSGPD